jgi:hypothetical protein
VGVIGSARDSCGGAPPKTPTPSTLPRLDLSREAGEVSLKRAGRGAIRAAAAAAGSARPPGPRIR